MTQFFRVWMPCFVYYGKSWAGEEEEQLTSDASQLSFSSWGKSYERGWNWISFPLDEYNSGRWWMFECVGRNSWILNLKLIFTYCFPSLQLFQHTLNLIKDWKLSFKGLPKNSTHHQNNNLPLVFGSEILQRESLGSHW